jgi:anti-anti-sigma factor
MPDWSEDIIVTELADEPQLSEELGLLIDRLTASSAAETPSVVLNFAAVTYVNSSNLAQLLRLKKTLADAGRHLRLCSVSDEVWSVMMITGLDKVFHFAPDPLTALAGLQIENAEDDDPR